jgi:hypothetical protein
VPPLDEVVGESPPDLDRVHELDLARLTDAGADRRARPRR